MYNRRRTQNLDRVAIVAKRLGDLCAEVVFLGGSIAGLLITDPAAPDIRATLDVDLIVEATTRGEYYKFHDKLREKGFMEAPEEGVICRWKIDQQLVDVMPIKDDVFGFVNPWYPDAVAHSQTYELEGLQIQVIAAPYFLGTKLEAFKGRGDGDFIASHDIEDIIAVLDGRPKLVEEIRQADARIMKYLSTECRNLLANEDFLDAMPCHLPPDTGSRMRTGLLRDRIRAIADLTSTAVPEGSGPSWP